MLYRLAVMTGTLFPEKIADLLTAKQLRDWELFYSLEPFDGLRDDYNAAGISQTIANVMGREKGQKAYTLEDMVVKFGGKEVKQKTQAEMNAIFHLLAHAMAGEPG